MNTLKESKINIRNGHTAFQDAIAKNFLSDDPNKGDKYAGKWMYMHSKGPVDVFKHIDTRRYISFNNQTGIVGLGAL